MDMLKVTELVKANISKAEITKIEEESLLLRDEGVLATLLDKGAITSEEHDEIADNNELMLALHTELVSINNSTGYLTIVEVTDNDGWILEFKPYETNVLNPNNEHHDEFCKLLKKELDAGNNITISRDEI